jgi:hypothetical protein
MSLLGHRPVTLFEPLSSQPPRSDDSVPPSCLPSRHPRRVVGLPGSEENGDRSPPGRRLVTPFEPHSPGGPEESLLWWSPPSSVSGSCNRDHQIGLTTHCSGLATRAAEFDIVRPIRGTDRDRPRSLALRLSGVMSVPKGPQKPASSKSTTFLSPSGSRPVTSFEPLTTPGAKRTADMCLLGDRPVTLFEPLSSQPPRSDGSVPSRACHPVTRCGSWVCPGPKRTALLLLLDSVS